MARSCVTDPRWRELVALYRYDWIAAADVLFGKTPTWQQDLIIESVQEQGSKTSVSSGHGTGKSDMTSIMIMLFIIMYPGARAIIVANKIQQVMTGIFKYIKTIINYLRIYGNLTTINNYISTILKFV